MRNGDTQMDVINIDIFYFIEKVAEYINKNLARVAVQFDAKKNTDSERLYFSVKLPESSFANGNISLIHSGGEAAAKYSIAGLNNNIEADAGGVRFTCA